MFRCNYTVIDHHVYPVQSRNENGKMPSHSVPIASSYWLCLVCIHAEWSPQPRFQIIYGNIDICNVRFYIRVIYLLFHHLRLVYHNFDFVWELWTGSVMTTFPCNVLIFLIRCIQFLYDNWRKVKYFRQPCKIECTGPLYISNDNDCKFYIFRSSLAYLLANLNEFNFEKCFFECSLTEDSKPEYIVSHCIQNILCEMKRRSKPLHRVFRLFHWFDDCNCSDILSCQWEWTVWLFLRNISETFFLHLVDFSSILKS